MKLIQLNKAPIFFLILLGSVYMNASDTLKVRKVKFFIEPKAVFIIPRQSHVTNSYLVDVISDPISYPPHIETDNWQNKNTINFGISSGISVRLGKYFNYELSLAYNHNNVKTKATITATDLSGNYLWGRTYNGNISSNALFISNGLSFKYKRFIFSNNIMIGVVSQTPLVDFFHDIYIFQDSYYLMSEHKIGYSLFKNRIETCVGINVLYNSPFGYSFEHPNYRNKQFYTPQNSVMPFTSIRVNF
ncbi:MAG TPA: hypothetical protein VF411_13520 [Bacteroidia bacterium]